MKREFITNLVFLLAINLIIKPLYLFGVDRGVQNTVGEGEYGLYFTLNNFTLIFQIICDFGIQYFNNRHIGQHPHLLPKYLPVFLTIKGLLALLYIISVLFFGLISGFLWQYPLLLVSLMGYQLLSSFVLYLRTNISGLGWYRIDSLFSVMDRALLIVVIGIPMWQGWLPATFSIQWFINLQLFSLLFTAVIILGLTIRYTGGITFRWNKKVTFLLFKQSFPYAMAVALMSIYTRIDGVMIERLLPGGNVQAGIYASGFRLLDAFNMFGYLFAVLLLPMYARMLKTGQALQPLVNTGINLIWSGTFPLVAAIIFFRTPIMEVLYRGGDVYSGNILGWLIISFVPMTGSYIFSTLLVAQGSLMSLNRVYVLGVLINIALNFVLIPRFQALGAAMANCITQNGIFIAQLVLCWRIMQVGFQRMQALKLLTVALVSIMAAWVSSLYLFAPLGWMALIVAIGVGFLSSLLLKLINIKELMGLIGNKAQV
jgi:O-antigen/teichoic acid export membrane protein